MRILSSKGRNKSYVSRIPLQQGEMEIACTNCATVLAVPIKSAALVTNNEAERTIECSVCGNEIHITNQSMKDIRHGEGEDDRYNRTLGS